MRRALGTAAAVLLLAAGCGGREASRSTNSDPPPTAAAVTTVTTAGATTASTVTSLPAKLSASSRLRTDGVGPILIGMTVAEARAAAGVELTTERLPYCTVVRAPDGPAGVELLVTTPASGRIDLIIVKDGPIATLSGIRVGDTEADVLTAYPGRIRVVNPSLPVHRLVYDATDRAVVFVIDGTRVVTMYSGLRNQAEADEICS